MKRSKFRLKRNFKAGFTLLEVIIAVTIMTLAFSAILTSQSGSISQAVRTKELNLAGWLAHNKMVDSEHVYEGKPFSELPQQPEIKKSEAPYERFTWKREIKELKFPDIGQGTKEGQSMPEPVRILVKAITKFLNDSIREMIITVTWQKGTSEQQMVLTTYLIDLDAEFNFSI